MTHVGLRHRFRPPSDHLPHAEAISQRFGFGPSACRLALITITLVGAGAFDLALAPLVCNLVLRSMPAKVATVFLLLGSHRRGNARAAVLAAMPWSAAPTPARS